jgi:hypothetical protein
LKSGLKLGPKKKPEGTLCWGVWRVLIKDVCQQTQIYSQWYTIFLVSCAWTI